MDIEYDSTQTGSKLVAITMNAKDDFVPKILTDPERKWETIDFSEADKKIVDAFADIIEWASGEHATKHGKTLLTNNIAATVKAKAEERKALKEVKKDKK